MIKSLRLALVATMLCGAVLAVAKQPFDEIKETDLDHLRSAQVVIIGELHDNTYHHDVQARLTQLLEPKALVFEMLDPDQAAKVTSDNLKTEEALEVALGWNDSGWPDFSMYYPIFAAASDAAVYGALVSRKKARAAVLDDFQDVFGPDAALFGLTAALDDEQQSVRETLQQDAHCGALPEEMLPSMVRIQRLRDAQLARAIVQAFDETGGPVVVITGNGHARADWGAPVYLRDARPELNVVSVGQGENGDEPSGVFDVVLTSGGAPDRGDPCAAFK